MKFNYKNHIRDLIGAELRKKLLKNPVLKCNQELIEFAKKPVMKTRAQLDKEEKARKREEEERRLKGQSKLVWGNPQFGIYERFEEDDRAKTPGVGQYW